MREQQHHNVAPANANANVLFLRIIFNFFLKISPTQDAGAAAEQQGNIHRQRQCLFAFLIFYIPPPLQDAGAAAEQGIIGQRQRPQLGAISSVTAWSDECLFLFWFSPHSSVRGKKDRRT